ncbi:accessory Sec system S-layer assembly protein [Peribacillus deserti]|uniref:Accessory Sec system S-layer assembly protein n=1 Tax=Peribacillus deserti TaxID=673318 RepID=A0ABS2QCJ3_9BACI|nr:accessory Sec system S-layer assembly protein [Peribacillus deserti]MBM7690853.1 accessory Sec system S-layer assembly protein [Peribacillus deserti]
MALFKFKKKKTEEKPAETPAMEQQDLGAEKGVRTVLNFHPEWEMSNSERYIYQYRHQQLEKLEPNQLSIYGLKLSEYYGDIVVVAFLRNTLPKPIRFETVDLLLLDENGQPIARQQFELDNLGELPAMSCTPWRFLFESENILAADIPEKGWKIAFELKKKAEPAKHSLDLEASWEDQISQMQREKLSNLVAGLPHLAPGEVNFMGIEAVPAPDGAFAVTVLIRNGSEKNIKLEQIPLIVEDAEGDIICRGGFTLDHFEVKGNTSKPWTFVFPASLVMKQNPDLSRWKVYPPSGE